MQRLIIFSTVIRCFAPNTVPTELSLEISQNSLTFYLSNTVRKDVGNAGSGREASGVVSLGIPSGVHGRDKFSVHRKWPREACSVNHPRVHLPAELPGENTGDVGGVREPLDHRLAGAADAVAREEDRVGAWNLVPSENSGGGGRRERLVLCRGKGKGFGLTASVLAGERTSEAATRNRGPPRERGTGTTPVHRSMDAAAARSPEPEVGAEGRW